MEEQRAEAMVRIQDSLLGHQAPAALTLLRSARYGAGPSGRGGLGWGGDPMPWPGGALADGACGGGLSLPRRPGLTCLCPFPREVWPEQDVFGSPQAALEEEIQLLRQILFAPLPREYPCLGAGVVWGGLLSHHPNAPHPTHTQSDGSSLAPSCSSRFPPDAAGWLCPAIPPRPLPAQLGAPCPLNLRVPRLGVGRGGDGWAAPG